MHMASHMLEQGRKLAHGHCGLKARADARTCASCRDTTTRQGRYLMELRQRKSVLAPDKHPSPNKPHHLPCDLDGQCQCYQSRQCAGVGCSWGLQLQGRQLLAQAPHFNFEEPSFKFFWKLSPENSFLFEILFVSFFTPSFKVEKGSHFITVRIALARFQLACCID
jgi:hypothetical protein